LTEPDTTASKARMYDGSCFDMSATIFQESILSLSVSDRCVSQCNRLCLLCIHGQYRERCFSQKAVVVFAFFFMNVQSPSGLLPLLWTGEVGQPAFAEPELPLRAPALGIALWSLALCNGLFSGDSVDAIGFNDCHSGRCGVGGRINEKWEPITTIQFEWSTVLLLIG
jgi:hypothetical protein